MIDKDLVVDFAEQSGFGAINRHKIVPRLMKFAELVAQWENNNCSEICSQLGNHFSVFNTEFMDGKMDGAYLCESAIEQRWKR